MKCEYAKQIPPSNTSDNESSQRPMSSPGSGGKGTVVCSRIIKKNLWWLSTKEVHVRYMYLSQGNLRSVGQQFLYIGQPWPGYHSQKARSDKNQRKKMRIVGERSKEKKDTF